MNKKNLAIALLFIFLTYLAMAISFIVGGQYLCEKSGGTYTGRYCMINDCIKDITVCRGDANTFYMVPKTNALGFNFTLNNTGDIPENTETRTEP